ncbi:hypothetical protein EDC39_10710 [Geothermobacter ehrlichii]|uniref:Uncharacterized protein n=1 Tax=Geothermobacter ehrlichii TaxID=213224 RepID=A0A5D3WIX0_9BACT|nr:hypothetical protein EDC39_10710 [Geothermobacter ehrlichii]
MLAKGQTIQRVQAHPDDGKAARKETSGPLGRFT